MHTMEPTGSLSAASAPPAVGAPAPLVPVRRSYMLALGLAQFGITLAIFSPAVVSMQVKAQALSPENPAAIIGAVMPLGAVGALLANPLAGALSDRTRTRWGRRRPWLLAGAIGLTLSLVWVALAPGLGQLMIAWLLAQITANATVAPLIASFADNVPHLQRGRGSSVIALAQNLSVLAGTYLATYFVGNLPVLFVAPGFLAIALVIVYALIARDELPQERAPRMSVGRFLGTFWTNPLRHPDFGLAWWSRLLITLAMFMFTTYRLLYMQDRMDLSLAEATATVAFGVLLYTIALLAAAAVSGWLSDRLRRRKVFVAGSTLLFGIGTLVLAHAGTIEQFYVAELIMGLAYGVYSAVDTALVVDVLPDPERAGKDLGVVNIANMIPQSLAPALGLWLLQAGSPGAQNYTLMLWVAAIVAVIGALVVLPIRRVR